MSGQNEPDAVERVCGEWIAAAICWCEQSERYCDLVNADDTCKHFDGGAL